jgi:hypothetical protein
MVSRCGWSRRPTVNPLMSVFKNGKFYHYEFKLDGRRRRGSTGTANKQQAIAEERRQRERLEKSYSQVIEEEAREQQRKTIRIAADEFLKDYRAKHEAPAFGSMPSGM